MNKHNRSIGDNPNLPLPSTKYNHQYYQYDSLSSQSIHNNNNNNQPCKSPSPDKKRSNIITPTKSPQLLQIKRNITPLRLSQKKFQRFQKTPVQLKPSMRSNNNKAYHQQSTKYYTNEDFQQYRSSQHKRKNQVMQQQLEDMFMPQQFMLGTNNSNILMNSSYINRQRQQQQYRTVQSQQQQQQMSSPSLSKQLDYIKLLQQKQRTIKELHEIIQMINRNNSLDLSASCGGGQDNNILSTGFKGHTSSGNNKKLFETTYNGIDAQKLLMLSASKIQSSSSPQQMKQRQQLKQKIKTLTIQNQQLIHMIEKINNSSINQKSINKKVDKIDAHSSIGQVQKLQQQLTQSLIKQQHLSRQLKQTKYLLETKQFQLQQLQNENKQFMQRCTMLDLENQKLIKMMKQKQLSDRKYHASLIQSMSNNVSANNTIGNNNNTLINTNNNNNNNNNSNSSKQRLSLIKIKQQYNESLKVFKDTVCGDVQQFMAQMGRSVRLLQQKLTQMQQHVKMLERFKQTYDNNNMVRNQGQNKVQGQDHKQITKQLQMRRTHTIINDIEQLSQIQMTSPQKISTINKQLSQQHQPSILYPPLSTKQQQQHNQHSQINQQRYTQVCKQLQIQKRLTIQYEQQLIHFKQANERLQQQYNKVNEHNVVLQQQYSQTKQRLQQLQATIRHGQQQQQQLRLKIQLRDSRQNNNNKRVQQIQDINMARAQQKEIQTLKQMIMGYQEQLGQEKRLLMGEIEVLLARCKEYQNMLGQKGREYQIKECQFKQQMRSKQLIIQKVQQQMHHRIQQLQRQLQLSQQKIQQLQHQLQHHNKTTQLKLSQSQQQLNKKQHLLQSLQQTLTLKQHNESHTHEEIQKLVQNYQKQIHLLKQRIVVQQQKYHEQLQQKMIEIKRLVIEGENVQRLMQDMGGNYNKEMDQFKQRIKILQEQLNIKIQQNQINKSQYQQLLKQYDSKTQHIDRLLIIANEVQKMQEQHQQLKSNLANEKQQNTKLSSTLQSRQQQITKHQLQRQQLIQKMQQQQSRHLQQQQIMKQQINQLNKQLFKLSQQMDWVKQQNQQLTLKERQYHRQVVNQKQYLLERLTNQYNVQRLQHKGEIQRLGRQKNKIQKELNIIKQQLERKQQQLNLWRIKYNQLVQQIKNDHNIKSQLNQLRQLITNKLLNQQSSSLLSTSTTNSSYDMGKIIIDYQSKCQQIITLNNRIQEQSQQIIKLSEQKFILEQKLNCLQKNTLIYLNEIKERKILTDKLLLENTKLQKQIVLIKQSKIEYHHQQTQKINVKMLQMINKIVKLEDQKYYKVKSIIENNDDDRYKEISRGSPIRQVVSLVQQQQDQGDNKQRVDNDNDNDYDYGFDIKKVDEGNDKDNDQRKSQGIYESDSKQNNNNN